MQPRRGTWSFDDHTTSTWVPAELGLPSPGTGPSAHTGPERDEPTIWDDPEEATRKLSSQDIARTLDSATDLEMDWDEDESTTNAYDPSHALAMLQASPQAELQPTAAPNRNLARPQSAVRQRAVRPEDLDHESEPHTHPATAAALDSSKPLATRPEAPPQRTAAVPPAPRQRTTSSITARANPGAANVRPPTPPPVLRTAPPARAPAATLEPVPTLKPVSARRMQTMQPMAAPPPLPPVQPRTRTLMHHAPPAPPQPLTDNEHAWTRAWEDAQELARTNLPGYVAPHQVAAPPQAQHVRHVAHLRVDGPTYTNFPPAPVELHTQPLHYAAHAHADRNILPLPAAVQQLRAAQALPFEADDLDFAPRPAQQTLKQLALASVIPGLALFAAVLVGRALLAGPAPAPTPAPAAQLAPPVAAPTITPEPAPVDRAPSAVAPTPVARPAKSTRSRSHARDADDTSDIAASAPRATRTREVFDTEPPAHTKARAEPAERAEKADLGDAPAAAAVEHPSGIGILRLNSRPWSQVFVDGKLVGNTPQMGLRLKAGSHQIELVNPQLAMHKQFQVQIEADEIVTRAELLEESGSQQQ